MATKTHQDGGTYETIAFAETRDKWAIAITRWTTYRGNIRFEVLRADPENRSLRLDLFNDEKSARDYGNQMWRKDR